MCTHSPPNPYNQSYLHKTVRIRLVPIQAFIEDEKAVPDIWGHHTLTSRFHETIISGPRISWGSERQFGSKLKDYLINSGIGPRLSVHTERLPIPPTRLVTSEVQHETIAGGRGQN